MKAGVAGILYVTWGVPYPYNNPLIIVGPGPYPLRLIRVRERGPPYPKID